MARSDGGPAGAELGTLSGRALRLLPQLDEASSTLARYAEALESTTARTTVLRARAERARDEHARLVAAVRAVHTDPTTGAFAIARADQRLAEALADVHRSYGRAMDDFTSAGAHCARTLSQLASSAVLNGAGRGPGAVSDALVADLPLVRHGIDAASQHPVGHAATQEEPAWWETALTTVGDASAWAYNHTVVPLVNGAANVAEAAVEHPEDLVEMAAGAGMVILGGGGEMAGLALDATGVGTVVGVPVNVAAAGLVVAGASMAMVGAADLGEHAAQQDNRLLNEVDGSRGGSGRGQPGEPLPDSMRPDSARPTWKGRVARDGNGEVWQSPDKMSPTPNQPHNAESMRIKYPDAQYPHGCVRFYNSEGQPLNSEGRPGPNSETHFAIRPDGTFDIPKGWSA